jgi:hypothetical protein
MRALRRSSSVDSGLRATQNDFSDDARQLQQQQRPMSSTARMASTSIVVGGSGGSSGGDHGSGSPSGGRRGGGGGGVTAPRDMERHAGAVQLHREAQWKGSRSTASGTVLTFSSTSNSLLVAPQHVALHGFPGVVGEGGRRSRRRRSGRSSQGIDGNGSDDDDYDECKGAVTTPEWLRRGMERFANSNSNSNTRMSPVGRLAVVVAGAANTADGGALQAVAV